MNMESLEIFKREVDKKIKDWITNLDSVELNDILYRLELHDEGDLFERGNRLYRRLQGDYTAEDFLETQFPDSDETHHHRDQLCMTFIKSDTMPREIRDPLITNIIASIRQDELLDTNEEYNVLASSSHLDRSANDMSLTTMVDNQTTNVNASNAPMRAAQGYGFFEFPRLPVSTAQSTDFLLPLTSSSATQASFSQAASSLDTLAWAPITSVNTHVTLPSTFAPRMSFNVQPPTSTRPMSQLPFVPVSSAYTPFSVAASASHFVAAPALPSTSNTSIFSPLSGLQTNCSASLSSNTGTMPRLANPFSGSSTLREQDFSATGDRLVWRKLPDGKNYQLPEPAADMLKNALQAEYDLKKKVAVLEKELQLTITRSQNENKQLLHSYTEVNVQNNSLRQVNKELQAQMQQVLASAQKQIAESQARLNATRTAKSVGFNDTYQVNYFDDIVDITPSGDRTTLNPKAQIFHSTTKAVSTPAFAAAAAAEAHAPAASAPTASSVPALTDPARSSWGRGEQFLAPLSLTAVQAPTTTHAAALASNLTGFSASTQPNSEVSRTSFSTKHLGKTVREWKIKFSGVSNVSIEEFLEQVEENSRLDRVSEQELLDSMTPLFEKPALFWYRQMRPTWISYKDFKEAALLFYSKSRRNRRSLAVEANSRTQGPDEPVRDYIVSLLTIFGRFEQKWSLHDQIDLIIDNMLPTFRSKIRTMRSTLTSVQELIVAAQNAEDDESTEQWQHPPPPASSILPESAYYPKAKITEPPDDASSTSGDESSDSGIEGGSQ